MYLGYKRTVLKENIHTTKSYPIPSIGSIEVLNGCGKEGVAMDVARLLRENGFDVKNVNNAQTWNYQSTLIISRTCDMNIAQRVGKTLHTKKIMLLRNNQNLYNVSVIIGHDYGELLK